MTVTFYLSYALLWTLVIFQSLVVLGLVRVVYRAERDEPTIGPRPGNGQLIGQQAPGFRAVDVFGAPIDNSTLAGQTAALLFVSPDCSTCAPTLEELEALKLKANGTVMIFCRAGRDECRRLVETYGLSTRVVVDDDLAVSDLFGVNVTPTAVLVTGDGRVQKYGHPMRSEELEQLMASDRLEMQEVH